VVSPKPPGYVISPEWEGFVDEVKLVADEFLDAAAAERLPRRILVLLFPSSLNTGEIVHPSSVPLRW
jgi:hypothetical protein